MPVTAVRRSSSTAAARSSSPVLRQGARGSSVVRLQNLLRAKGYRISADGAFGPGTAAAVKAFQRAKGLGADGVVGPRTWAALGGGGGAPAPVRAPSGGGGGIAATGYRNGRPVSIRLTSLGGGKYVNSKIAGNYRNLLAAARRAGFGLSTTSGFRSMASQQALYRKYGPGRAARPGYSDHQMGMAIDIGGIGGYGTRAFRWMKANAGRYGFVNNVRGEPWHWAAR